jgi:transposase
VIIAEIGVDMSRFPTPGHLASWAKFAPGIKASAGKTKGNGSTGKGATATWPRDLGEAALTAGRTDTFLGARHRHRSESEVRSPASLAFGRRLHELSSQPLEPSAVATALERQLNSTCHQK